MKIAILERLARLEQKGKEIIPIAFVKEDNNGLYRFLYTDEFSGQYTYEELRSIQQERNICTLLFFDRKDDPTLTVEDDDVMPEPEPPAIPEPTPEPEKPVRRGIWPV